MSLDQDLKELNVAKLRAAMRKEAGAWRSFTKALKSQFGPKSIGGHLGAAAVAAGVTAAGEAGAAGVGYLREKIEKPKAFKDMLSAAPGLKKQDPKAVQRTFNTLYTMNRGMARDPLVAGSFVSRNVGRAEMDAGAGAYVDPQTVKLLSDVGRKNKSPIMDAWRSGASGIEPTESRSGRGRKRNPMLFTPRGARNRGGFRKRSSILEKFRQQLKK